MSKDEKDDVGVWWVLKQARATYAELRRRWDALLAWGVGDTLPNVRRQLDAWREFSASWEAGDEDTSTLSAMSADLQVAESYAREGLHGRRSAGARPGRRGRDGASDGKQRPSTAPLRPWGCRRRSSVNTLPEMAQGAVRAFQELPRGVQLGAGAAAGGLALYGVHRLAEATRRKRRPR
ncbi:hypothetical protein WMF45_13630 [Sorangium sp. So ce448]|uniref:hypothetical protein n=1 Tax=Sorangium sp. So ce448 TaxID=3133314 RepID=UPI003F622524